jgi:hypothetical protein
MRKILIIVILIPLIYSCKKEVGIAGPVGPQGPAGLAGSNGQDTGTIIGTAFLYNEFGFKNMSQSGTAVTLISGNEQLTDTTNSSGIYQFHGIATGTYNLTYGYPNYGTVKKFGLSHFGGGTLPTTVNEVDLVQIPVKTAIKNISASSAYGYAIVTITLDTSSLQYLQYYQNFLLIVGKSPNLSQTDYVRAYNNNFNADGFGNYVLEFAESDVSSSFNIGDTMYITACPYNRFLRTNSSPVWYFDGSNTESYIDPNTGYVIFPNAVFAIKPLEVVL